MQQPDYDKYLEGIQYLVGSEELRIPPSTQAVAYYATHGWTTGQTVEEVAATLVGLMRGSFSGKPF